MKLRGFSPILAASLALTIGAAGCGSSSSSSTSKSSTSHAASSSTPVATSKSAAKAKAAQVKATYKPGEFCSSKNESLYKAQGLACVNGHLKKS